MKPKKTSKTEVPAVTVTAGCRKAETVGSLLKQARQELGCDRSEAALRMKIPERYVAAFEEGAYEKLPDDVYSKIYLKVYCKFLGLDIPTVIKMERQERMRALALQKMTQPERRRAIGSISAGDLVDRPRLMRNIFLGLLALGLLAYFGWAIKNIIAPPVIDLVTPTDGQLTSERQIIVEGRTEREVSLQINGRNVATDGNGWFRDSLDLQDGLNVIRVVGAKKHSREMVVTRRVIVESPHRPTAAIGEFTGL